MGEIAFGNYRLIAELGHGGMADVFLAVTQGPAGFSKLVVVKRLRANFLDDPEFRAMLIDEARIAGRLNHPNVVQTNEVVEVDDQFFITMEFLEGHPLQRIIHRSSRGGFSVGMHLRVLADALSGLHHAHELTDYDGTPLNVVHRDATPHNIFVTYEGHVKVVDFGIAKAANRSSETRTGVIKGKIAYMSPEQAMGGDVDRRADIFSFGVMLWDALAGRRMWAGVDDITIMHRLISGEIPRSPRQVNPSVPEALDRMAARALAYDPNERYATALELQQDIEDYLREEGTPVGTREVGEYVSRTFQDCRAHQRAVIERQLAALKMSVVTPRSDPPAGRERRISESARDVAAVAISVRREPTSAAPDAGGAPATSEDRVEHRRPRRRLRRTVGFVVTAAAIGAGVLWASSVTPMLRAARAALVETGTAAAAPSPPQVPEVRTVALTLRASPAEAQFRIDDGEIVANPSTSAFTSDGKPHKIEISAPTYVSKTIWVSFTNDREVSESLERAPVDTAPDKPAPAVHAPARRARSQPKNTATRATAASPAPTVEQHAELDSSW